MLKGNKDGAVSRTDLMQTVMRYRDHIGEQATLDKIFDEYDKDKNGTFDADELLEILKACAPEGLVVDDGDAQYILELCDTNENGMIDRDELQPMIARWKMIAQEKAEEQARVAEELSRSALKNANAQRWAGLKSGGAFIAMASAHSPGVKASPKGHGGASDATDSASSGPLSRDGSTRSLTRRLTTTFTKTAPGAMFRMASSVASMLTLSHLRRSSAKVAAGTRAEVKS